MINTKIRVKVTTLDPKLVAQLNESWAIVNQAPQSIWIEYGTQPHPVSHEGVMNIADWCMQRLGKEEKEAISMAYAIANRIKAEGSEAHPFLRPAMDRWSMELPALMARGINLEGFCRIVVREAQDIISMHNNIYTGEMISSFDVIKLK